MDNLGGETTSMQNPIFKIMGNSNQQMNQNQIFQHQTGMQAAINDQIENQNMNVNKMENNQMNNPMNPINQRMQNPME